MSDKFYITDIKYLLQLILNQLESNEIFGIPVSVFFKPAVNNIYKVKQFDEILDTPVGVAAGPHTQMAQNIIAAWLCGARYIELKTIQTLDELEISKPCIDMADEGYNCEWSQELKIKQSYEEYLKAWIIIHILHYKFNNTQPLNTIFNMSAGYNLSGILNENVQWFFAKMTNCETEKIEMINSIRTIFPEIDKIVIPNCISDNITLSTMHGCPPEEIEKIGSYLIENKKLNTYIKLNPTLIGSEKLRNILNKKLGFKVQVPDEAFEHDLKYSDAISLIKSLQKKAILNKVFFGLKLTNTLESLNQKGIFSEKMMYMSGRALHPISVQVARKLQNDFEGELNISFSAGVDCFNISDILACGISPVTVCSDLLKPGGYARLNQYFKEIDKNFENFGANSITDFIHKKSQNCLNITKYSALENLNRYADEVVDNKLYKRNYLHEPDIKTNRELNFFDCIAAPCMQTCGTNQNIPDYLYYTSTGDFEKAYYTILETNPFPSVTGLVCDHLCQQKCTRMNYDNSLQIRNIKRFIAETCKPGNSAVDKKNKIKCAIIGAGPSGLSCAWFLALNGANVTVFEQKSKAGGMVSWAIPGFRLSENALKADLDRISNLGVDIRYNEKIDKNRFDQISKSFDFVYIAAGAQNSAKLDLAGVNSIGVLDPLQFLFDAKIGKNTGIGKNILVIGGGNTAMDAARVALREAGDDCSVKIVYRRTIQEMPADQGEIIACLKEGIELFELAAPERIETKDGKVSGLWISRMTLGEKDGKGRRKPVKIENSEYLLKCDTIIPAIGQDLDVDFVDIEKIKSLPGKYTTQINNIFVGGDLLRGASTAINAIGDGRRVAAMILQQTGIVQKNIVSTKEISVSDLKIKRYNRLFSDNCTDENLLPGERLLHAPEVLTKNQAITEADRCLHCDLLCNICVTVCPNLANREYMVDLKNIQLQKIILENTKAFIVSDLVFNITQKNQVFNIADWCNECGNCATFCPTSGAPYKDKPKVHLTDESFQNSPEGFFIENDVLFYKKNNFVFELSETESEYIYNCPEAEIYLDKLNFTIKKYSLKTKTDSVILIQNAINMIVVKSGIKNYLYK